MKKKEKMEAIKKTENLTDYLINQILLKSKVKDLDTFVAELSKFNTTMLTYILDTAEIYPLEQFAQ
jgi:sRNA-binding regulator protein Hfq